MKKLASFLFVLLVVVLFSATVWAEEAVATIHITSPDILSLTDKSRTAPGYFEYCGTDGTEVSGYITAKVQGTLSVQFPKRIIIFDSTVTRRVPNLWM